MPLHNDFKPLFAVELACVLAPRDEQILSGKRCFDSVSLCGFGDALCELPELLEVSGPMVGLHPVEDLGADGASVSQSSEHGPEQGLQVARPFHEGGDTDLEGSESSMEVPSHSSGSDHTFQITLACDDDAGLAMDGLQFVEGFLLEGGLETFDALEEERSASHGILSCGGKLIYLPAVEGSARHGAETMHLARDRSFADSGFTY